MQNAQFFYSYSKSLKSQNFTIFLLCFEWKQCTLCLSLCVFIRMRHMSSIHLAPFFEHSVFYLLHAINKDRFALSSLSKWKCKEKREEKTKIIWKTKRSFFKWTKEACVCALAANSIFEWEIECVRHRERVKGNIFVQWRSHAWIAFIWTEKNMSTIECNIFPLYLDSRGGNNEGIQLYTTVCVCGFFYLWFGYFFSMRNGFFFTR